VLDTASAGGTDDLLRILVADVQDYAILMLDEGGRIATWNAGAERFKGWRAEEIIGQDFSVFYPPEDVVAGKPRRELEIAAAEGRLEDEGWRVRKDGTRFWANVVITAVRDSEGRLRGYGKVTRDLTERRAQERAVVEREQLVTGVLNAATEQAIIGTDLDGTITVFNTGAERMLGYGADDVVGRATAVQFHDTGEIAARAAELGVPPGFGVLTSAAARGEAETREWTYVRADGARLPVELTITAILGDESRPRGFIGVAADLTARRHAEAATRAAEDRFRHAFHDAPVGLALSPAAPDAVAGFLDVNKALCEITGYPREQLIALGRRRLTHPADLERDDAAERDLLAGRIDRHQGEKRYLHAGGDVIDVSVGVSVVRDGEGRPLHLITQVEDITARKRYERQLRHMAHHDPLTGLYNRARLDEAVTVHIARVRRHGPEGAVLLLDIDHFKQVNDRLGHGAGDDALIAVGRVLQSRVRDTDLLARLGGDEFAILLSEGGEYQAQIVAADISDLIRRRAIVPAAGIPSGLTVSIGIAVFDDRVGLTPEDVLAEAEAAMFTAKQGGTGRISAYVTQGGVRQQRTARLTIQHQIHTALEDGRFQLRLQPVQDLATGRIGKHEVLLRMVDDDGVLTPPATFLYVAERSEQINAIDRWVIERSVELLSRLPPDTDLEVNLSGRSLGDRRLMDHINAVLKAAGADPARLIFEITETAAIQNIQRARQFADELTHLGCRFALDDFGAGFGSFYYLKYLPFDYLKIDGEFVKDCTENRTDQLVIQSCVQLARGLGKQTIAEYVESAEILRLVRALGVDHAQGFEIAGPLAVDEAVAAASG
jgi:diguanylate cyclase (GGDEF)-like protein/PAS domain S-box-containing protein